MRRRSIPQRMSEKGSALDFQGLQKALQDLNESRDAVGDGRLIGAAEPEQLQRDHAMRGAEWSKTPGPLVGITTEAVEEHQHRPIADVVVTDPTAARHWHCAAQAEVAARAAVPAIG